MLDQTLRYGETTIPYRVVFRPGRRSGLAIHLLPDGSVQVEAPEATPLGEIKRAVARRARWLTTRLHEIRERQTHVLPREYVSGESHLYLGRRYLLKVRCSTADEPFVKLKSGRLEVTTRDERRDAVRELLWGWYRCHAQVVFNRRLDQLWPALKWVGAKPEWKLRTMKRQWGSCSPAGVLSLNPHLVKAPPVCIDYVLLHELCHLQVHDHSPRFYRLMSNQMPGWEIVKRRLDGLADELLNV